jgi:uncharacterized membrane protein
MEPVRIMPNESNNRETNLLSRWLWVVFVGMLAYGIVLRCWDLGSRPFRVDEAETSINALTILQHGVPVDHYLGLPLFENTLSRSWPENAEYEFKDTSYSSHGLVVYHGWVPLYILAATYALAGIGPDEEGSTLAVRHPAAEVRRRTIVGRIPGVLFGGVFLLALFAAAREWYGTDAAWAVLTAAVICEPAIYFARQARYYSATLALTACSGLLIGRVVFGGKWRHFVLLAVTLVLLFHTHLLSFVAAAAGAVLTVPWLWRREGFAPKLGVSAAIVAAGTIPWIVLTGFIDSTDVNPRAWSMLSMQDLSTFLAKLGLFPLLAVLTLAWLFVARGLHGRLPGRLTSPFADRPGAFLFLAAWGIFGAGLFVALMPAASFFCGRIVLTVLVPGLLFGALLSTAVARVIVPRYSALLASGLMGITLLQAGQATFWGSKDPGAPFPFELIEYLRGVNFSPGARAYASPNHHLTLTFYTGIPIQSAAPVRKEFFDDYPGEIWILEAGPRYERLTVGEMLGALRTAGRPVSESEVRAWESWLATGLVREDLQDRVARVTPVLQPAPALIQPLLREQRRKTEECVRASVVRLGNPMFKGYRLPDYLTCWQIFYYRFVNPEKRIGPLLNYADRIRTAEARVLPQDWVVLRCPARGNSR